MSLPAHPYGFCQEEYTRKWCPPHSECFNYTVHYVCIAPGNDTIIETVKAHPIMTTAIVIMSVFVFAIVCTLICNKVASMLSRRRYAKIDENGAREMLNYNGLEPNQYKETMSTRVSGYTDDSDADEDELYSGTSATKGRSGYHNKYNNEAVLVRGLPRASSEPDHLKLRQD